MGRRSATAPLAEVVEHILSLVPGDGPIDGVHLVHIWTLARTLANERAAEEAAAIAMSVASPGLAFEDMMSKSVDTVSPPAAPAAVPSPATAGPAPVTAQPANDEEFTPSFVGVF